MDMKKAVVVSFSPTGGTKKAAMYLAGGLGMETEVFDITDYEAGKNARVFSEKEVAVFAVPVFGGRVPSPAAEKIRNMKGNQTPAVLLAVYGNRASEDALVELKDLVEERGFVLAAGVEAVAEHSIMRRFAAGRPDGEDAKELEQFGEVIAKKLADLPDVSGLCAIKLPGNVPYREYNGVPFKPQAGKKCTECGVCAALCPVKAIPAERPSETDMNRCISCMRCIAVCPEQARGLNKLKLALAEKASEKKFQGRKANVLYIGE